MDLSGFDLIELIPLRGTRRWHEWECYFKPERVLVLTDLAFNLNDKGNPGLREFWPAICTRLSGQRNKLTLPWIHRLLAANKKIFEQSLVQLSAWSFERVVLAHGDLPSADDVRVLLRE